MWRQGRTIRYIGTYVVRSRRAGETNGGIFLRTELGHRPRLSARVALLLTATLALSAVAVPAVAAPPGCDDVAPVVTGPWSVYLSVGHPVADHVFSTGCSDSADWELAGDLPPGVTFDAEAARFVGTPTTDAGGSFELRATDFRGTGLLEGSFEVVNTQATVTGLGESPVDLTEVSPGTELEVHGFAGDGTTVDVLWDGESLSRAPGAGVFSRAITVPGTAERGAHLIDVVFEFRSGQSYTTSVAVNVAVLELTGPPAIYPVVGIDTVYTYVALGAGDDAIYWLDGELPAGMTFDADAATISGAPEGVGQINVSVSVLDDNRQAGVEVTVDVLPAAVVQFPALTTSPQIFHHLAAIADLIAGLNSKDFQAGVDAVDEILEKRKREAFGSIPGIPIGPHPETGEPTVVLGSELENQKEQNRLLTEAAKRAAAKAKQEQVKALEEERKKRQQAEKDKQELLKIQNEQLQKKLKEKLEKQKAANEKAAEEAKKRAEEAFKKKLENDAAREAFEKRQRDLEQRQERHPLPQGTTVRAELHSTPVLLAQTTVSASGGFLIRTQIPAGTAPGAHHLVVTYTLPDGTVFIQAMAITVFDPNVLPPTGADVTPIGFAGGTLLVLGVAATLLRRRLAQA